MIHMSRNRNVIPPKGLATSAILIGIELLAEFILDVM